MDIGLECLGCGRAYRGRPNRRFCGALCKDRENNRRRRIRTLSVAIEHSRRQSALAKLGNDAMNARFHAWRERQLRAELQVLISIAESR